MKNFRGDCRGQVIVVAGLLVAVLLISTAVYVIDVGQAVPKVDSAQDGLFMGYTESVRNTMVSALANISGGGDPSVLTSDLEALKTVILAHSYQAQLSVNYDTLDNGVYVDGVWVSWGSNGDGVSSVYASFAFNSSNSMGASEDAYALNVTSSVHVTCNIFQSNQSLIEGNLTVAVFNEAKPALAEHLSFCYQNGSDWLPLDSPVIVDHGDGSYAVSFTIQNSELNGSLNVSTLVQDQRGISIGANLTCNPV